MDHPRDEYWRSSGGAGCGARVRKRNRLLGLSLLAIELGRFDELPHDAQACECIVTNQFQSLEEKDLEP